MGNVTSADSRLRAGPQPTSRPPGKLLANSLWDRAFFLTSAAAAAFVVFLFLAIVYALYEGAQPAIKAFGFSFLLTESWNPVTEKFGALAPIYGTIITSLLAMMIAVPVGIGIAVFLTQLCPRSLRSPIGIAVELLAGIPSIIYGVWGLFVFAPFFQKYFEPKLIDFFSSVPVANTIFSGVPYGIGIFTASIILSIMILPFIAAITRDVFETVPAALTESGFALSSTKWEVTWHIVLPYTREAVVGGAMLALGRALGETMAVTFVVGNAHKIHASILEPGTTISAAIANEFTEAVGTLYLSSLIELGLILFLITFIVLAAAQLMLRAMRRRSGVLAT